MTTKIHWHTVVTQLSTYTSTSFLLRDNVTTKNRVFLGRRRRRKSLLLTHCPQRGHTMRNRGWGCSAEHRGQVEKSRLPPYSPTVPGGDTPCVTADDARRVNPWIGGLYHLRHRRCRTAPTLVTPSTLAVRRFLRRTVVLSLVHGFSLAPLGHHPRLSMVRLRRRRELCCEDATEIMKG